MHVTLLFSVHDASFTGWTVTVAYAATACACAAAWRAQRNATRRPGEPTWPWFWPALVALMVLLAANKQLDLQNVLTSSGRSLARAMGWHAQRRVVQAAFIAGLMLGFALVALTVLWLRGPELMRRPLASSGIAVLAAFVLFRAAAFHHVIAAPTWTGNEFVRAALELLGCGLIVAEAVRALKRSRLKEAVRALKRSRSNAELERDPGT